MHVYIVDDGETYFMLLNEVDCISYSCFVIYNAPVNLLVVYVLSFCFYD